MRPSAWIKKLRPWFALAIIAALAGPVSAQTSKYKADEVDNSLRSRGSIVTRYLQTGDGDDQEFRDYFQKYYFPSMTEPTPDSLGSLGKASDDLFKKYLSKASGAEQTFLSDEALKFAANVVRGRYHPAVRLNAFLILGRLNDNYGDDPVPSAKANAALCSLAKRALQKGRSPRYELTASLTGLQRHARYLSKLPKKQQRETQMTLYAILKADNLPGEYDEGVRDWIYLQAANAVSELGSPGPNGAFALILAKRFSDKTLSLETRAELASKLGDMNAKPGSFKTASMVKAILGLAAEIGEREADFAKAFEDLRIGGRRKTVIDPEMLKRRVKDGGQQRQGESELIREGLVELLVDLRDGVRAVNAAAGEAGQAGLARVDEAIGDALETTTKKSSTEFAITEAIQKMAAQIEAAASPALAPPEDAVDAE